MTRACIRSPSPREGSVSGDALAATSPAARGGPEGGAVVLRQLTALSRAVAQAASLADILDLAARQAAGMLGADQTILMLVGDDGRAHSRAVHGIDASVAAGLEGELNERLIERLEETLVGGASRVFMAVPLIVQGEVTGLLAVTRAGEAAWTPVDEAVLAAVADQSAAPIEIARLSEEVRQARLVAENLRLSEAERAARAELDTERLRLASVLDNIPSGVVLVEAPSGRITFVNRAVAELLRLRPTAAKQSVIDILYASVHADGRPYAPGDWPLARALVGGESVVNEEVECVVGDGTSVTFSVNATAIRDPEGVVVAAVATLSDVTHRRQVERHLRQVQQMEAVGRLAGGVAHEANNQMLIVLSAAAFLLRRTDLEKDAREDLRQIERAAERTATVTAQLLAFSRRQILRPTVLELDEVVNGLVPVLRRTLGEACTVELKLMAPGIRVRVDRGQLEQVLINLALNARDAMPQGGVLTLQTRPVELGTEVAGAPSGFAIRPRSYLRLTFTDTGQGMSPETLGHLFEPFFTTKPVGKGTGLGLATVYGIVKQSEGYVWAASEPGKGATFTIHLPIVDAAQGPAATALPSVRAIPGEVVLVVEDEPDVLTMTARVLRDGGYDVLEAANGRVALDLLEGYQKRLDLLVTDVAMPQIDGIELAARLRRTHPHLPVVFTSGHVGDEGLQSGLLGPESALLLKPFPPDALITCARSLLDKARIR
jgi:two-component system cell cycle sensor histidine kinase/response regulator CckA